MPALLTKPRASRMPPGNCTQERQRLADSLAERGRRQSVADEFEERLSTRRAARFETYRDIESIEAQLSDLGALEAMKMEVIARGDDPSDIPTEYSLRSRLAHLEAEAEGARTADRAGASELERLRERVTWADADVDRAVAEALAAEPVVAELAAEFKKASVRAAALERALRGAFGERGDLPRRHFMGEPADPTTVPPCPWSAAAERLKADPDTVFPSLEQGLALAGIPAGKGT